MLEEPLSVFYRLLISTRQQHMTASNSTLAEDVPAAKEPLGAVATAVRVGVGGTGRGWLPPRAKGAGRLAGAGAVLALVRAAAIGEGEGVIARVRPRRVWAARGVVLAVGEVQGRRRGGSRGCRELHCVSVAGCI